MAVVVAIARMSGCHRLPESTIAARLVARAHERGDDYPKRGQAGSCPTYLWIVMEIAYTCRLRSIEVVTLTDAHLTDQGLRTNRRKGSRDNVVTWGPRLRAAVTAAQQRRATIWEKRRRTMPLRADQRPLIVSRTGEALTNNAWDTAWQRFIRQALEDAAPSPRTNASACTTSSTRASPTTRALGTRSRKAAATEASA